MFIAYVIQDWSDDCDYHIDCGKTLWKLRANSLDGATTEIKNRLTSEIENNGYSEEYKIGSITIFEVINQEEFDVRLVYQEIAHRKNIQIEQEKDKQDYAEYVRLQKKFSSGQPIKAYRIDKKLDE